MFYNHYYRLNSYYGNAELAHKGEAYGHELELLQKYKNQLPEDVFKESFKNPSYESDFIPRENLQQAIDLLKAAGWQLKDQKLTNKTGEVFEIVIPYSDIAYETIILHMQRNFENIGIKVIPRHFDASTFSEIVEQFDYDMVHIHINQSHSLGNEQREYFGSESAKVKGSKNLAGIENKVIDDLIEKLVDAKDYYEMVDCAHAIDRVLSWNYYMIMNWQADGLNSAYWNIFDMPKQVVDSAPKSLPFPIFTWWIKAEQPEIAKPKGLFTKIKQTIKGWFL